VFCQILEQTDHPFEVGGSYCDFFFAESISKFGSGLFLLVQVVLLLEFVHGWNENWIAKDEQFWLVACHCPLFYLRFH
jgi:hypothetical protein